MKVGVVTAVVVSSEAAVDYRQKNPDAYDRSLMKETLSWCNSSNIPDKNKEPLFWVGGFNSGEKKAWRKGLRPGPDMR